MLTNRSGLLAAAFLTAALPFAVAAQEACTTYTVQDGDTLGEIAMSAYGSYNYQMIFNANRQAIGDNPTALPAGLQLILPCEDGRLSPDMPLGEAGLAAEEDHEEDHPTGDKYSPPVKLLTANDWQPFTDESLTGGGIYVQMATTALHRGGNEQAFKISYVDDWGSHIDTLLPTKAFDISIAWSMPDCSKIDMLGEFAVKMCTEFDFSDPIYEVAYSYYTLTDSPFATARKFMDYAGAKICRPEGWPTSDLEVEGLAEPVVTFVRPKSPMDCAKMLLAGEIDLYSIEIETSSANFEELGATDKVELNPALATFNTHHFLAHKSNPKGREILDMLNRGMQEMRETGEWYDIVATGLAEYNAQSN